MSRFDATELASWTSGQWKQSVPGRIDGFCNDTRTLKANDLFIALKTSQRDGHDYLEEASRMGASGALVSEFREEVSLPQLVVDDSLRGFQLIATEYRNGFNGQVVGVTGSCGKTTCKELIGLLLGATVDCLITQGNLNNFLGVPLTLTNIEPNRHRFAVVEAGISELGEMDILSGMIQADIAVCTSVGAAHLEELGTVENVAGEKSRIVYSGRTVKAYVDDTSYQYSEFFGDVDLVVARESAALEKVGEFFLERDGLHCTLQLCLASGVETFAFDAVQTSFATNVALATLVAFDLGVDVDVIRDRLSTWKASSLRGELIEREAKRIYLDCYNANPLSMFDALESFRRISNGGRAKLYIIGSMEELGTSADEWHRKLGAAFTLGEKDCALLVGDFSDAIILGMNEGSRDRAKKMDSIEELKKSVAAFEGDVFVKGSRRYCLEAVLEGANGQREEEGARC